MLHAGLILLAASLPSQSPDATPARPARVSVDWPEGWRMFGSILANGAKMGPGTGWFLPGDSRYDWPWLAHRADANRDGRVSPDEWKAAPSLFERLDRDADGALTAADLDWSPSSPNLQRQAMLRQRFSMLDANGNGRVSQDEFLRLYQAVARDDSGLTPDDLGLLFGLSARRGPTTRPSGARPPAASPPPGMMPSRWTLLKGFVSGEIGAFSEGPDVGDPAPDFTLPLAEIADAKDGQPVETHVRLSDQLGEQPVILIFGSFT